MPRGKATPVVLICSDCKGHNYSTRKMPSNESGARKNLEYKKYCSTCRKHTVHKSKPVKS